MPDAALMELFAQAFEQVMDGLEQLPPVKENLEPAGEGTIEVEQLYDLIDEVEEKLSEGDVDVVSSLPTLVRGLQDQIDQKQLKFFRDAIVRYDFDEARDMLGNVRKNLGIKR